jgi:hypothetical protein
MAKAFGDHLDGVRQAMDELASRFEPAELNRIGFRRLYEKFRPDVPYGNEGWGKRAPGRGDDPGSDTSASRIR